MKSIKGLHHVSCIVEDLQKTYDFYTSVLGFELIKKTIKVNDVSNYHLYFSCNKSKRNDVVSFFTSSKKYNKQVGTNSIDAFSLLVESEEELKRWHKQLTYKEIKVSAFFQLFDYTAFSLKDVNNITIYFLNKDNQDHKQPYPMVLGPILLKTNHIQQSMDWFTTRLNMKKVATSKNMHYLTYNNASIILIEDKTNVSEMGIGSIDHAAFEVEDMDALQELSDALTLLGDTHSTILNRMYYYSLYVRDSNHILVEFVNHNLGYTIDEAYDHLGESLSLPNYLQCFKQEIIKQLPLLKTK